MKIVLKNWNVKTGKEGTSLAGTYAAMSGQTEVAAATFNNGYGSTDISIPADIMADALKLDERVRKAVEDHFAV